MIKKTIYTAISIAVGVVTFSATTASAATFTKSEYVNNDVCYRSRKVPATFLYNTQGELVSGPSRSWSGNPQVSGSIVRDRYNDPVYIQKKTQIEEQHVTLVPVPCRR